MRRTIGVVLVAALVVLAGCAGGDGTGVSETTTATTTEADETATATATDAAETATATTAAGATETATATTADGATTGSETTTGADHIGCQPGEISKNGTCTVAVTGQNAEIFDATNLSAITASRTTIGGTPGYLARPADDGRYPAVVMIHEWWGLNENIEHMADVLAGQGYVVFAVDLYDGEVATNASRAAELSGAVRSNPDVAVEKMSNAVSGLRAKSYTTAEVASLGWCFGGGQSLQLSLSDADLNATVVYYGSLATEPETLQRVDGPVLGIFGAEDQVVSVESVRAFEETLGELGVEHEIHVYDGAGHAFANPSSESFHPDATRDAWSKTLAFLDAALRDDPDGAANESVPVH